MNDEAVRTDLGGGLAPETMPSLTDFAEEAGGAWPKGWYAGTIIAGFTGRKGTVMQTEDTASKQGDSRNLKIILELVGPQGKRNTFTSLNYRIGDFTPERLANIKAARTEFKDVKGKWPGAADLQRSSLALAQLGQLSKALGFDYARHPQGHINPTPLVGQRVDVRLGMDEENKYNEVTAFAAAGSRAGKA